MIDDSNYIYNGCGPVTTIFTVNITVPYAAQWIQLDLDLPAPEPEKIEDSAGCSCEKCKNYCEYASPNQPDKTFICYACSHGL